MYVLGISAFYHDSAACVVRDGVIVAAAQEERFTRVKHDAGFPEQAIAFCLGYAGITIAAVDLVAFYDKPLLKWQRLLETYLAYAPRGVRSFTQAMSAQLGQKIWTKEIIRSRLGYEKQIIFLEHHQAHAAAAFFPSPFSRAAILTIDGVGEWATTSVGVGAEHQISLLSEMHFPHSLGLLYSAFTAYLGFRVNSGEYKVMGLAPYGSPRYRSLILAELMDLLPDGSFHLNMRYFEFCYGLRMINARFCRLLGGPPRRPEAALTQRHMDIARSIQDVTEEAMLRLARQAHQQTGADYLCLAGGVALNCVGNGRIAREGLFREIWIQPAAGDAGGALGAALFGWHQYLNNARVVVPGQDAQQGSYLGPEYTPAAVRDYLRAQHCVFQDYADEPSLLQAVAARIAAGEVVGWFQGRMEFGPRALGARSILADPRRPDMQQRLNRKIKFRESFRPFAPAVLREFARDYFVLDQDSPYMLLTVPVAEACRRQEKAAVGGELDFAAQLATVRSSIPAVTHVDYSARVQTVDGRFQPRFYALLKTFAAAYGCPVLINTSFNIRGEPIVNTPEQAYICFMRTEMDCLCIGNSILDKKAQRLSPELRARFKEYAPD